MQRIVIALTFLAAFAFAASASATGDRYELWGDTNGDGSVESILDTDPGTTNVFTFTVPGTYFNPLLSVYDTATGGWTPVGGTNIPVGVHCSSSISGLRCVRF